MVSSRRYARKTSTRSGVFEATRRARALVAAGVALILVSPFLTVVPAYAALVPVVIDLSKTTSAPVDGVAGANESVTFDFTITCSSTQSDCVNLVLTDSFPDPLIFDSVNTNSNYTIAAAPNGFALTFTNPLDEGGVGLVAGESVSFQAIGHVVGDVDASFDGATVVNTAYATVDNPDSNNQSSSSVVIEAPLVVSSTISKSVTPNSLVGFPGVAVAFTLGATNTSNATVDTLQISDPAEAVLPTNAYQYLTVTSLSGVVFPSGANRVQVDYYNGTAWINGTAAATAALPAVPTTSIKGLRFTFSNSNPATDIARGAAASVTINTVTNAAVAGLVTPFSGLNIASSQVIRGGTPGTIVSANGPFTINPAAIDPIATKTFSTHDVVGGENLTATLGAQNGGDFTLTELAIVEPQTATSSFADQGFEFVSINQSDVFWPTGATSVDMTYVYDDALPSPTVNSTTRDTLPAPEVGRTVIGFTANFLGTMAPGQYATVPFTIHTLPTVADLATTNTIRVDARTATDSASTTASDDLLRRSSRIATTIDKTISPALIFASGNAPLLLSLRSQIDPRPTLPGDTGGSTIGATQFEVTDDDADFWDVFNPTNIVFTEVPTGSKLQILYSTDGGLSYPTSQQLLASTTGPTAVNVAIPGPLVTTITGIKFVYTPSVPGTLLQPGFNVQPNIRVQLRSTERASGNPVFAPGATVARVENNDATSYVENIDSGQSDDDLDSAPVTVQPAPADGGPGYDLIEKAWVEDEVLARSSQNATTVISWGTGGQQYTSVVITDTPAPTTAAIADTVYDSFDLFSIAPITASTDPLMQYDAVSAVQYYSRTTNQWEPLNDNNGNINLCTITPCNGSFPGYTLSAAERADAIGVRLIFVENPNRPAPTSASAPLIGSGVAQTTTLNRHISLVFQLRTVLRTDPSVAVLGTTRGQLYNTASAGQVNNVVGIEGRDAASVVLWDEEANDEILILDSSLNVVATKTWVDGPLGVPPVGTTQSLFPIALMTVTAQNASVVPVNELKLEEPTGGTSPFDVLNIVQIEKLSGSTDTTSMIVLEYADGSFSAPIDIDVLVTMTAVQLQDVVSLTMTKTGPIAPSEIIGLQLHTQLREFVRDTVVRTSPGTVQNETTATVTDPGGTTTPPISTAPNNVVTDEATASIDIEAWSYGAVANKSISTTTAEYGTNASTSTTGVSASSDGLTPAVPGVPQTAAIQYDNGEAISSRAIVTVSGQPTGNVRTTDLVLTDTAPTFWNVYNFVSLNATPLADSRKRVQVDVLIGAGAWGYGVSYDTSSGISTLCSGDVSHPDCWITGTPSLTPALPTMPSGSQVSDIRGLRFTFTNADGSAWERPYNPPMSAIFTVDRRATLVSDGSAVPSTLFTYTTPTPGESQVGVFTNAVTATASARASVGSPALWSASADASSEIRYQHLPARVRIKKSPVGAQSLNTDIPYKIVVTNAGGALDRELGDVVVTDTLPVDTSVIPAQTMLVVPDDVDGEPQAVSSVVTVRVSDASNATLPTPTFTATLLPISGSTQDIVFDFDDAWVLPRLATLTITVNLQFSPQLEAGTPVLNTATVTADQPFEQCEWYIDNATAAEPLRTEVNDCYSSTTVYPLASAPVTIVKGVRGVGAGPLDASGDPIDSDTGTPGIQPYDDLGILKTVPASSVNCTSPNVATGIVAEYYRYPCVPITRPGGIEEWASTFTNGGNIGLTQIVAIDVLPVQNDRGVIVNEARGSKWTPTLTSYPSVVNLPTDATFTVYYVTNRAVASQRCNGADIQATLGMVPNGTPIPMTAGYVGCYNDPISVIDSVANRNATWQVLSPAADAATLASVVAMKFVITMTNADPLQPGTKLSIVYQSQTSSVIQISETGVAIDNQSVAYNSIAAAAAGFDPSAPATPIPNRFVTEPRKVGVALATGSIELSKAVTGAAASRSQASFNVTLNCISAGTVLAPRVISIPKDSTVIVHGLPLYASCTISESSSYNQNANTSSITPGVVTAQAPQTAGIETIFDPNPVFGPTREAVELSTITNDYPNTTFTISKTLDINGAVDAESGGAAVYPSDLRFSATCNFNNGATNPQVFNQSNIDLDPGSGTATSAALGPVPVGSVCVVTETSTRAAQSTSRIITVGGVAGSSASGTSATFTVDDSGNNVAFTNTYGVGSLTLTKVVGGAWATSGATPAHTTGTFTVQVTCTRQLNATAGLETTFSGTVTLSVAGGLTHTINNIAQGSLCTITEPGNAGATRTTITTTAGVASNTVTINSGNQTRNINNFFDEASLSVTKDVHTDAVDTDGDVVYLDAPYTVNVSCTFQGNPVYATGFSASPMVLTFTEAELGNTKAATETLSGLPAGATCSVTETPTPANADSVRVDWNTASTSGTSPTTSATVGPLTANGVAPVVTNFATVNNYYDVGHFTVTKALRGDASTAFGLGPFTIHVFCESGGVTTYDGDITITPPLLTATIDDIAVGSVCSAEETGVGRSAPDAVVYIDAFGATDDGEGIDVMDANPHVTIENWYLTGSVEVTKTVIESSGFTFGSGPFEVTLVCERDLSSPAATVTTTVTRTMDPATPSSMTQVFGDLPNGAVCTLSETDDGDAASTTISNGTTSSTNAAAGITFTVSVDTTIISSLDQVQPAISVENNFTEAALRVLKTIDSDALDADGNPLTYGPFPATVDCIFDGDPVYGTGYSSTTPMTADLTPGTPWDIVGLPSGAVCTVTEADVLGAVDTTVTITGTGTTPAAAVPTAVVDLQPIGSDNIVTFDNEYAVGSIDLSKSILGLAATTWGTADFTVSVTCELNDASTRADSTVFDETFDRAALLAGVDIDNLPVGAECTITETNTGVATTTQIDVTVPGSPLATTTADTVAVTVVDDTDPIEVEVKNTFDFTSITVQKERDGDTTGAYDVGPFEVTLACTFDGYTLVDSDVPDGLVRELTLANSYFTEFVDLPVGADCTVTETNTGGANSTDMRIGPDPAPTTPGIAISFTTASAPTEVYALNHYELGDLAVSKAITGPGSFLYGDGSPLYGLTGFEVTLYCERDVDGVMTEVPLPYADTYVLNDGEGYAHTFEDLPVGAVCEITETQKGFASTSTVGAPVTITPDAVGTVSIDVVNDFQLGSLRLGKQSLGVFAARHDGQEFEISVECWQDVDGTDVKIDPIANGDVRTIRAGEETEFEDLPVPAECTFDETDNGGADMGVYSVAAVPMFGSTIEVQSGDLDVDLANLFLLAHNGSDVDGWIIGALISLLLGVCLVVAGRRRERVVKHAK